MKFLTFSCVTLGLLSTLTFADEITIDAAASLATPLKELAPAFEKSSGHKLKFVFGNSDELARALKEGGGGDVFFSANDQSMDALENAKLLVEGTRREVLANALVIVAPHGDSGSLPTGTFDLTKPEVKKIGLVKPGSVPVGVYAEEYLKTAKLWELVKEKVVSYEGAGALMAAVDASEVDAAIIFKTDVLLSKKSAIVAEIAPSSGPRIEYALALVAASKQPDPANLAVTYLAGPAATPVFEKYGFIRLRRAE